MQTYKKNSTRSTRLWKIDSLVKFFEKFQTCFFPHERKYSFNTLSKINHNRVGDIGRQVRVWTLSANGPNIAVIKKLAKLRSTNSTQSGKVKTHPIIRSERSTKVQSLLSNSAIAVQCFLSKPPNANTWWSHFVHHLITWTATIPVGLQNGNSHSLTWLKKKPK